jgi:hypothetical protein
MTVPESSFKFFRSLPANDEARIALASSMQSLESVLLLIALRRYPHALTTCAAAIESAIKSSSAGQTTGRSNGLRDLLETAKRESKALGAFPEEALSKFRRARNRITHDGFSPRDDSESVDLLLEVGLPFLHQCYLHLFSFDLWDALLPDHVSQLKIGAEVYARGKTVAELDRSYCLKSLGHLIRWSLKDHFSADWELDELAKSEESGGGFEFKHKQRQELERLFGPEWLFDCPLCREPQAVVCQLDEAGLRSGNIVPQQMACINCGLVVRKKELYLSEELLKDEIATAKEIILRDYGL